MSLELSEQELLRRQATEKIRELGIDPYPAALYDVNAKTTSILEEFPKDNSLYQEVSIAGRIMSRRIMGAASFVVIQDSWGKIQLYVKEMRFVLAKTRLYITLSLKNFWILVI